MLSGEIILRALGTYKSILYATVSNSDLPIEYKAKVIEIVLDSKEEVLESFREKCKEAESD